MNKKTVLITLGVLGVGAVAYFGFKKGGWFRKKTEDKSSAEGAYMGTLSTECCCRNNQDKITGCSKGWTKEQCENRNCGQGKAEFRRVGKRMSMVRKGGMI